jgi:hypothetical protein
MRRIIQFLLLSSALGVVAGCSRTAGKEELPGRYSVTIGDQHQVIQIHANGIYDNLFYQRGSLVWRHSETWTYGYDRSQGEAAVTFARFQFGLSEYASSPIGFWPVKPERTLSGVIELCFDPDLSGRCFVREGQ